MAITPTLVTVTVTTAGTRVRVTTDATIKPSAVYFEALGTNTGYIYIGGVLVSSTVYFARLTIPSASNQPAWSIKAPEVGRIGGAGIQLSDFYIDSSVNGEKVQVTYMFNSGT